MISSIVNGVPTKFDVDKLDKRWPELKPHDRISYAELEQVLEIDRSNQRWYTVMGAWRKRLRSRNIHLKTIRGEGYEVADGATRLNEVASWYGQARRRYRRGLHLAATTADDGLTDHQRRVKDHQITYGAALESVARTHDKSLPGKAGAVRPLPRPPVPQPQKE